MSIDALIKEVPDTAKDIRLNFSKILQADVASLTQSDVNAIMYAVAISLDQSDVMKQISDLLSVSLDEKTRNAAKISSSVMSMNNIYYRFVHLGEDHELLAMNAGLRMQSMAQHGIDKKLFELMSLAISALNGCGKCIQSHVKTLRSEKVDVQAIQLSGKIAAVLNAFNQSTRH